MTSVCNLSKCLSLPWGLACPCAQSWYEEKLKKEDAAADPAEAARAAGPMKPAEDAADFMVRLQGSVMYCVCPVCVLARVTIFTHNIRDQTRPRLPYTLAPRHVGDVDTGMAVGLPRFPRSCQQITRFHTRHDQTTLGTSVQVHALRHHGASDCQGGTPRTRLHGTYTSLRPVPSVCQSV